MESGIAGYAYIIERYEKVNEARQKYLKQQLKQLDVKNDDQNKEGGDSDDDKIEDVFKVDVAKVDESKQMDFAKVENVFALQVVGVRELLGIYVFERIQQNTFSILISIMPTMTPKSGLCVKILSLTWIQMKSSMLEIIRID